MTDIELDHSADWELYEDEDTEWDLLAKGLAHVAEPDDEAFRLSNLGPEMRGRARARLGNHLVGAINKLSDTAVFDVSDYGVGVEIRMMNDEGEIEKICGFVGWHEIAGDMGNPLLAKAERLIAYLESIRPKWSDAGEEIPF